MEQFIPPSPVNRAIHHISYLRKTAECSLSYLFLILHTTYLQDRNRYEISCLKVY